MALFKKFLMVLGAVFLLLIIAGGVKLGLVYSQNAALSKESAAYANQAVPAMFAQWDSSQLDMRIHPKMQKKDSKEENQKLFSFLHEHLGELKSASACVGGITGSVPDGSAVSALYQCNVVFDRAPVTVELALLKDSEWKIARINVASPIFQEKKQ